MASSSPIPPPAPQELDARIRETIDRSREVIQQAREAMVKANLILEVQADHAPKNSSP